MTSAISIASSATLAEPVKLEAGASATAQILAAGSTISASGAASLTYDHYLAVSQTGTRLDALTRLAAGAKLPQAEPLASLLPGEASRSTGTAPDRTVTLRTAPRKEASSRG